MRTPHDPIDWRSMREPTYLPSPPRTSRRWGLLLIVVIAAILFGGRTWLSYYVDSLWFGSLGYGEVFWKSLGIEWAVFAVSLVAMFLLLYGTFVALKREHLHDSPG